MYKSAVGTGLKLVSYIPRYPCQLYVARDADGQGPVLVTGEPRAANIYRQLWKDDLY